MGVGLLAALLGPPAIAGGSCCGGGITVSDGIIILGAIDRERLIETVEGYEALVTCCYQDALVDDPDLRGRVVVRFTVGKDGRVTKAGIKSTTAENEGLERCLVETFLPVEFQKPVGGGIAIISYPLLFSR